MKHPISTTLVFYSLLLLNCLVFGQEAELVQVERNPNAEPAHAYLGLEEERYHPLKFSKSTDHPGYFTSEFEFQSEWNGKQLFVTLNDLNSPYSFRINGFTFGYGGDHPGVAEFNITPFINAANNNITIAFENPDFSPSSIPDHAVVMYHRDPVHIRDIQVSSYPGPRDGEYLVRINLFVQSFLTNRDNNRLITAIITDPAGSKVGVLKHKLDFPLAFKQEVEITFDQKIKEPMLWAPDHPNLYTLQLHIEEKETVKNERIITLFGIRNAYIVDSLIVINQDTILPEAVEWSLLEQTATKLMMESHDLSDDPLFDPLNHPLNEYIVDLIMNERYNTVIADRPIPSSLMVLFDLLGIIVIKKESGRLPLMERPDINRACVIWME